MTIQILVSTMHRDEFLFLDMMKLWGQVVVINQCDQNSFEEFRANTFSANIINTTQRGISNSRNEAILHAEGDILLTADDDIVYFPNARKKIKKTFENHPEADIIAFNVKRTNFNKKFFPKENLRWRKAPKNRYYSSVSIAYRKSVLRKANLHFHPNFGAGSKYLSGEESLLLRDARRRGVKIYESPEYIATVDCSTSTWFDGYTKRFFFDKGAWLKAAYPKTYMIIKYYFLKKSKGSSMSRKAIIAALNAGIKAFDKDLEYGE